MRSEAFLVFSEFLFSVWAGRIESAVKLRKRVSKVLGRLWMWGMVLVLVCASLAAGQDGVKEVAAEAGETVGVVGDGAGPGAEEQEELLEVLAELRRVRSASCTIWWRVAGNA